MARDIDSVLKQMRHEHTPSVDDRARVHEALQAALLVGGVAGVTQVTSSAGLKGAAAVKGAAMTLPVWVKGAIGVGAVVASLGGGVYGARTFQAAHETPSSFSSTEPASLAEPSPVPNQAEVTVPDELAQAESLGDVAPPVAERVRTSTAPASKTKTVSHRSMEAPVGASSSSLTSLSELRMIGEASRALREGRTEQAKGVLSEHERRYSNTALAQERAGLELLARCSDGANIATRRTAEAFLQDSPNSPLASTIRRECLK